MVTFFEKNTKIKTNLEKGNFMSILITVGREFGSGGRELGRRLADELGIAYYDNEILEEIIKETPYSKAYVQEICESRPTALYPIHFGVSWAHSNAPLNQTMDVYAKQNEVLHKLASASCTVRPISSRILLKSILPSFD